MSPSPRRGAGSGTRFRRPAALRAAVLIACVALSGCVDGAGGAGPGGTTGSGSSDEVASLASVAPSQTPTSGGNASDTGRPQLRLDMSDEEEERLWTTYKVCLKDHGVPVIRRGEGGPGAVNQDGSLNDLSLDQSGEPKSAYVACANKLPLQPPELDPDKNPQYADQWNDYIRCLRLRGFKLHVTSPGNATWDDDVNEAPSGGDIGKAEKECTMEVFGGKKK
ncbi:hypothetical protein ACIBF5_04885 [Micromonospora sp. NPDC050417]|uniref:hypothetical protein n=1 Tax=Micromonospora sp. NPDC050417 TaxID=3364280 RepID=UPI0037AA8D4E